MIRLRRVPLAGLALFVALALLVFCGRPALAHVTVAPTHSAWGASEQYTVTVPTERPVPTVKVQLVIPAGVVVYAFGSTPGWQREIATDASGTPTEITWSGGSILPEEYGLFSFMARNPAGGSQLVWKATQTYQDGLTVAWTGAATSQQPASVTTLGVGTATPATPAAGAGGNDGPLAGIALAIGGIALVLSLLGNGILLLLLRHKVL